jgi:hypothetical protein
MRLGPALRSAWVLLAVGSLCVTGCGGGGGGGAPAGPVTLFYEDFQGAFPGATWQVAGSSAGRDVGAGRPPPSLLLDPVGFDVGVRHRPVPSDAWTSGRSIDIYVFGRVPLAGGYREAYIEVLELDFWGPGDDAAIASVTIENSLSYAGLHVSYAIMHQSGWTNVEEVLPAGDSDWHDYAFVVYGDGTASWFRDGVERAFTAPSVFGPANLGIQLRSFGGAAWFDEVEVRRP